MRISDWSSDVCSSDRRRLVDVDEQYVVLVVDLEIPALQRQAARAEAVIPGDQLVGDLRNPDALAALAGDEFAAEGDRKSVASGMSVSVRGALGGSCITQKKTPRI